MSEILHTSSVRVVGGRDGHTISPDGQLDIALRRPASREPDAHGSNPEQLFAAGYAACFAGAMGNAARRDGIAIGEIVIDSEVDLIKLDERVFTLAVKLDIQSAGDASDADLRHLVIEGDAICPYSRAVRGNIDVTLLVKGTPARA